MNKNFICIDLKVVNDMANRTFLEKHICHLAKHCKDTDIIIENFWEFEIPFYEKWLFEQARTNDNNNFFKNLTENNNRVIHFCSRFANNLEYNLVHPLPHDKRSEVGEDIEGWTAFHINHHNQLPYENYNLASMPCHSEYYEPSFFIFKEIKRGLIMANSPIYKQIKSTMKDKISKLYINLTGAPRDHRVLMMKSLYDNNLFHDGYNSWYAPHFFGSYRKNKDHWRRKINTNLRKFKWNEEFLILPSQIDYGSNPNEFQGFIPSEYTDALVNIVTESSPYHFFLTEKTALPIMYGKPFLVLGSINFHRILQDKFGFLLYDELFDYSFDSDPDLKVRAQGIIDNLQNLKGKNYRELYEKVKDKIYFNSRHMLNLFDVPRFNGYRIFMNMINNPDRMATNEYIEKTNKKYSKLHALKSYHNYSLKIITPEQRLHYQTYFPLRM